MASRSWVQGGGRDGMEGIQWVHFSDRDDKHKN